MSTTTGQVLFTNTILGVRALTEKCPGLYFLMQTQGLVEKIQAILLFKYLGYDQSYQWFTCTACYNLVETQLPEKDLKFTTPCIKRKKCSSVRSY